MEVSGHLRQVSMIVECPYCEAIVAGKVLADHESYNPAEDPAPFTAALLECPGCKQTLVGGYYTFADSDGRKVKEEPGRLWPVPRRLFDSDIPELVRTSLEEAEKCFRASAYGACAVMCGRALEGACHHFNVKSKNLGAGLRELRDTQVIDGRLFTWATELQKSRNLSAHATGERISKGDAQDLLEFTNAICEYLFVLSAKFEKYMERKAKQAAKRQGQTPPAP
jgi:hypothetical protein